MTAAVETARAMLELVRRSPWREVHVRGGAVELFVAKPGGGASPMRVRPAAPEQLADLTAPHVATFVSALPVGTHVTAGDAVARIEVLGVESVLAAATTGRVAAIRTVPGALLDYGEAIVAIAS